MIGSRYRLALRAVGVLAVTFVIVAPQVAEARGGLGGMRGGRMGMGGGGFHGHVGGSFNAPHHFVGGHHVGPPGPHPVPGPPWAASGNSCRARAVSTPLPAADALLARLLARAGPLFLGRRGRRDRRRNRGRHAATCENVLIDGTTYKHCGDTWLEPPCQGHQIVYVVVGEPR